MIDVAVLKCEYVNLTFQYTGKLIWGLDCDLDELRDKMNTVYNYIALIENTQNCKIDRVLWNKINAYYRQLLTKPITRLCNTC